MASAKKPHPKAQSASNLWITPPHIVDVARGVMEGIDLDPASSAEAQALSVKAGRFIAPPDDGLTAEWRGKVWLNPPYGLRDDRKSIAGLWLAKALEEHRAKRCTEAVILINAMVGSIWFAHTYDWPICFLFKRLRFLNELGEPQRSPTYGNALVYLGPSKKWRRFGHAYTELGACFLPVERRVA